MEARIEWLEKELERVEAVRVAANKDANEAIKEMMQYVAIGAPISAKLRILSDPEKQYELHDWRSKTGDDVLLELMIREYQIKRDYEIYVLKMKLMNVEDRISPYSDFKDHPNRYHEYAKYIERLIETDGIEFIKRGGGRTYEEFDIMRCREISKDSN